MWFAVLLASACRFGGPSGDPTLPVADAAAGASGNGGQAGDGNGGQAGSGGGGGTAGAGEGGTNRAGSAGAMMDAMTDASEDVADDAAFEAGVDGDAWSLDTQIGDAMTDVDAADSGPPTTCVPPFSSAVCDPVCNTGCTALFRCDVTDTPRTGVCIGNLLSTSMEGMACTRTTLTDDCTERLSCVDGTCRRLCYRDADCTTSGTCCTVSLDIDGGSSGYRLCAPCMP